MPARQLILLRLSRSRCIYCGDIASSRDHVPPKSLFDRPFPKNLLTVSSCKPCNNDASLDEEYFLILLAQISNSPIIQSKLALGGVIDRALSYSPALEERLLQSLDVDEETGAPFIKPELDRVDRVIKKIAIGLFALRYGRIPTTDDPRHVALYPYATRDDRPLPLFIATLTDRFKLKRWKVIQKGVFSYIFVRDSMRNEDLWCVLDFYQSAWGVVQFPNPKQASIRITQQFRLFQ